MTHSEGQSQSQFNCEKFQNWVTLPFAVSQPWRCSFFFLFCTPERWFSTASYYDVPATYYVRVLRCCKILCTSSTYIARKLPSHPYVCQQHQCGVYMETGWRQFTQSAGIFYWISGEWKDITLDIRWVEGYFVEYHVSARIFRWTSCECKDISLDIMWVQGYFVGYHVSARIFRWISGECKDISLDIMWVQWYFIGSHVSARIFRWISCVCKDISLDIMWVQGYFIGNQVSEKIFYWISGECKVFLLDITLVPKICYYIYQVSARIFIGYQDSAGRNILLGVCRNTYWISDECFDILCVIRWVQAYFIGY